MKAQIIKIGNSRGIRLPKAVIDECGFGDEVDIKVSRKNLVITKSGKPRENWETMFKQSTENGSKADELLLPDIGNDFDRKEWEW